MEPDHQRVESPVNNDNAGVAAAAAPVSAASEDVATAADDGRTESETRESTSSRLEAFCATFASVSDKHRKSSGKPVAGWLESGLDSETTARKASRSPLATQGSSVASRVINAGAISSSNKKDGKEIPAAVRRKSLKRAHRTPVPNIKPIISITPVPSSPVHRSSPLGLVSNGAWDLSSSSSVCLKMPSTSPLDLQARPRTIQHAVDGILGRGSSPCQVAPMALTKKACDTPTVLDLATNGKIQAEYELSSENDSQSGESSDGSVGSEISEVSSKNDFESDDEDISRDETASKKNSHADRNASTTLVAKKPNFQQVQQSQNPLSNLEIMSSIALALDMSSSVTVTPVQSVPSPPLSSPLNLSMKRPSLMNDHIAVTPATAHASSSIYSTASNRGAKRGPKPKHLRGLSALTEEENQLRLRQEELKVQLETQLRQQQFQLKLARKAALYDRHTTTSPPEIHIQTTTSSQGGRHCIVTKNTSASGSSARHLSPSLLALSQGLSARSVSLLPPESTSSLYSSSHSKSSGFSRSKNPNGTLSLIPIESPSARDDAIYGAMKKSAASKLKSFTTKTSSDDDDSSGIIGSSIDSMDSTCSATGSSDNDSDSSSSGTETSSGRGQKRGYSSEGSSPAKKARQLVISEERELRIPLEHGWRRLTKIRMYSFSGARGEVVYFAPCGKKLKTYPEVVRYLEKNGINDIGRENFSFSAKHNVGEYLEPQGNDEYLEIGEAEVVARIEEFRARKGRRYIPVAMRRKMEDKHRRREESRQRRRLEQQAGVAMAQSQRGPDATTRKKRVREKAPFSAREARELKAAEARLQKEHVRFLRQQEKFEKQEQLRIEREVKAHHALEARKKRQELLEKQRMEETEREMKRLQAVVLREQERERRRQHMLLVKALETRKRQEERERMKEERLEEKKQIRERKMEERKLEMHLLREMRKPVDDMELKDSKPLPVFNRISGVGLAGQAFADILMVYEFLNNFGETLGFDMVSLPSLSTLQIGLLNDGSCEEEILSVLHHLLTCAIEDPGVPGGAKGKTALNQHLKDVDITSNTVSEVLRIFILATEGSACKYLEWLSEKPFMALTATQKASILAHLCNELLCSRVICRQIDNNIELINNMRRDKWMVEGKVRKLKMVHAKKIARQQLKGNLTGYKNPGESEAASKKIDNSAEDDIGNNNSDNEQSDGSRDTGRLDTAEEPEEEPGVTIEDLGKRIEKMSKQQNLCRRKLMRVTQQLRVSSLGQDRYRRRYWILPTAGGLYVESLQSSELADDQSIPVTDGVPINQSEAKMETPSTEENNSMEKDNGVKKEQKDEVTDVCKPAEVKEEGKEEMKVDAEQKDDESKVKQGENDQLDPQKPDKQDKVDESIDDVSVSVVSKLTPVMSPSTEVIASADEKVNSESAPVLNSNLPIKSEPKTELSDTLFDFRKKDCELFGTPSLATSTQTTATTFNHYYYPGLFPVPQCQISAEQIMKTFGSKSPEEKLWFSILPRMPCDETSLTRLQQPSELQSNGNPDMKTTDKCVTPIRTPNNVLSKNIVSSAPATSSSTPNSCSMPQYPTIQFSPFYFHGSPSSSAQPFGASAQMAMFNGCLSPFLMYGTSPGSAGGETSQATANGPSPYIWSPALMQQYAALRDLQQQQYSEPQPIPTEFRKGWWRITDVGQVKAIIQVLHGRGVREKMLQIKLQKYLDMMGEACSKGGQLCATLETTDKCSENTDDAPDSDDEAAWNRDVVRRLEISILEQVESLEEKVAGASMQLKQWKLPSKVTEDEGVRFYVMSEEPTPPPSPSDEGSGDHLAVGRQRYSALNLAKERLLGLEAAIERRYMKPPLGHILSDVSLSSMASHHQHNHSRPPCPNNGNNNNNGVAVDGSGEPPAEDEDVDESPPSPIVEEVSKGLMAWRLAVRNARSSSQLAVCLNYLEGSVAWDRSIMKASCQFCNSGDNEAMLLLCDGCDKGYHTYCFKPKMDSIPDGDWFCYECLNKATGNRLCLFCGKKGKNLCLCDLCPKAYHIDCLDPPLARVPKTKWHCPQCNNNNNAGGGGGGGVAGGAKSTAKYSKAVKARKSPKEKREQESSSEETPKKQDQRTVLTKAERTKERNKAQQQQHQQNVSHSGPEDMEPCKIVLTELETHADAWPFLLPVNTKQFPSYKKVIRRPMDMSTVHSKLDGGAYRSRAEFAADVRLVFDNCETFNEDDSPVGKAGHNLRAHFETLWSDVNG